MLVRRTQWLRNGADIGYLRGNVGVGTTSPDHTFAVAGAKSIFGQDITTGQSMIIVGEEDASDKSINLYYDHDNNLGGLRIGGDPLALVIANGGNVGIGTTEPGVELEVNGAVAAANGGGGGYLIRDDTGALRTVLGLSASTWGDTGNVLWLRNPLSDIKLDPTGNVIITDGNVGIGTTNFGAGAGGVLGLGNATAPTSSPADMVQVYAEDVSGSSELKVRDEAGNITVLS